MKTLLFTTEYPPFKGGVANYYANMVKNWPQDQEIFVLDNSDNRLLKGIFWPKWRSALFLLYQNIKKNRIDRVIVGQLLPLGIVMYLVSCFYKMPYTVIIHGMDLSFALLKPRKKFMARLIMEKAEQIICAGTYTAGLVKNFLGEKHFKKIQVVNPGVESLPSAAYESAEKIKAGHNLAGKIVLFTISRLVKRKGHDMALAAMQKLAGTDPRVHYYIAGTGPDEEYLKNIAKGMANVHFLGKVSDEEKWAWLVASDIFIMPARDISGDFEGFGIVYLEAALAGLPAIAGASGGTSDAVKNGETGFLVNPEDADEIAQAILKLARDENLRKKIGAQAKARAEKDFQWEKQAARICEIACRKNKSV